MTLVEAVMSLAILSIILLIASQLTMNMNMVSAEETAETQVQTDVRRAMSELIFVLEESRPVAMWREDQIATELPHLPTAPDGTYNYNQNEDLLDRGCVFTFSVPLKQISGILLRKPTDASQLFEHGKVYYGSGHMGNGPDSEYVANDAVKKFNTYSIFFLPDGEVFNEASELIDLDMNGNMTDRFIYGGLWVSDDATRQVRQITGRIAIKRFTGLAALYPTIADRVTRDRDGRGKPFVLESEYNPKDANDNGIYDTVSTGEEFTDSNDNQIWDVKMIIRFYFPIITQDSRRGRVTRLRVVETRVNYFRNTYEIPTKK